MFADAPLTTASVHSECMWEGESECGGLGRGRSLSGVVVIVHNVCLPGSSGRNSGLSVRGKHLLILWTSAAVGVYHRKKARGVQVHEATALKTRILFLHFSFLKVKSAISGQNVSAYSRIALWPFRATKHGMRRWPMTFFSWDVTSGSSHNR